MMELKDRCFDTTEVIKAESQAVLNTLAEHDFQDAFKKWQKCWEQCMHAEGVMGSSRPKVSSSADGFTSPRNDGYQ
jgi:hypothetical protein